MDPNGRLWDLLAVSKALDPPRKASQENMGTVLPCRVLHAVLGNPRGPIHQGAGESCLTIVRLLILVSAAHLAERQGWAGRAGL